ncbi:MAG: hypothetical protein PUB03_03135 [bacterium]|nr:hypothetical protein [bacterium]
MEDWYSEYIRIVRMEYFVKDKLKLAIDKIKEEKETNNLSAVDTLTLVDKEIRMLLNNLRKTDACIMIDYIASVKKPFVTKAKEEIAQDVANIIKKEPYDITVKVNSYFNELKEKGIDLDGTEMLKIKKEGKQELEKERLERESKYVYGIPRYPKGEIIKKARSKYLSYSGSSRRESTPQQNDTQFLAGGYYPYHQY